MTTIHDAVASLGAGPLTEDGLHQHIAPLFSRALAGDRARGEIYLANHSLGRPLDRTADDIAGALDLWYTDMDGAWGAWMDAMTDYRARVARLVGRSRPDAVVPKTAAGQGFRAVLNALPHQCPRVVATAGEFDSIDFTLRTYARKRRASLTWVRPDDAGLFHAEDIIDAITDDTDLVMVSHAIFATGQIIEGIGAVVEAAHAHNAEIVLDTYHTAGVLPMGERGGLDELGVDFAIGGNYKYTRGGPGACWLSIHDRHLRDAGPAPAGSLYTLDTGWFAKHNTFAYERPETPELSAGGDAWLESTPPFLLPYQAKAGLELVEAIGVGRLRAYSLHQQAVLAEALRSRGIEPRLIDPRGAFLLVPHPDAMEMSRRLKNAGVNTDARPCPSGTTGHVRLCPDILNTEADLHRAAETMAGVLAVRT
jgi:kynureninase